LLPTIVSFPINRATESLGSAAIRRPRRVAEPDTEVAAIATVFGELMHLSSSIRPARGQPIILIQIRWITASGARCSKARIYQAAAAAAIRGFGRVAAYGRLAETWAECRHSAVDDEIYLPVLKDLKLMHMPTPGVAIQPLRPWSKSHLKTSHPSFFLRVFPEAHFYHQL